MVIVTRKQVGGATISRLPIRTNYHVGTETYNNENVMVMIYIVAFAASVGNWSTFAIVCSFFSVYRPENL